MSFGLETLGMASGAGKSLEDILSERRADALMQMKGLETLNAQRLNQDYHDQMIQARNDAIEQRRQAAQDAADAKAETARRLGEAQVEKNIGSMMPNDLLSMGQFQKLQDAGGASFPLTRFQKIDARPSVDVGPLQPGDTGDARPDMMKFLGTAPQLEKIREFEAKQEGKGSGTIHDTSHGLVRIGADNTVTPLLDESGQPVQGYHPPKESTGRRPSFQEVDAASNMNSAEIQAVKVLKHLHETGLDQSNDPSDPRWNAFVAQDLKVRPLDEGKADSIQRTQYVKAVLARAIMGGRPSQYTMQMIEQHLPDSKMSGRALAGVMRDVLDEVRTKRINMQNFYGPDEAKQMEPVGGETYAQFLDALSKEKPKGDSNQGWVIR